MKLNKENMKKICVLITFSALMYWIVNNYRLFIDLLEFVIKAILPLILAVGISFVINVPMKQIENNIFNVKKRKNKRLIRVLSLLISIIIILGIIILLMFLIIPEVLEALTNIGKSIPNASKFITGLIKRLDGISPFLSEKLISLDYKNIIGSNLSFNNLVTIGISFLSGLVSKIIVLFIGFIISLYILIDKENLARQTKKILNAFFSKEVVSKIIKVIKVTNFTFTKFLTGQFLDAMLTGFIFFVVLSIFKIPYALILGVLFAFTALIPYIGAFITLVVGIILVCVSSPVMAIWYVLIFFLVQQFDDNLTYPKIVGGKVGLPALWSLLAVLVGGALFGVIGMIISIPIASILYGVLKDYINERLEKKKINNNID